VRDGKKGQKDCGSEELAKGRRGIAAETGGPDGGSTQDLSENQGPPRSSGNRRGRGRRNSDSDQPTARPGAGTERDSSGTGIPNDSHSRGPEVPSGLQGTDGTGIEGGNQPSTSLPVSSNPRTYKAPSGNRGRNQRRGGRRATGGRESDIEAVGRVKAENIKMFFEHCLAHVQGLKAGDPFILSDWQYQDIILPLFGTLNADGLRRYRTCYVEIPRKNGKSTLAAGIALALLFADGEAGAEIVSAAADREQASIVFDLASRMVQNNPVLSSRCQVLRKEIITRRGCRYRALSADAYTKHGLNCSGIIFDELHAQPNRELWDVLTTSVASRAQPLILAITTSGYDRSSLCYELHQYAKSVKDGSIVDHCFLPILYGAAETADWKSPETWKAANPGFGVSVRPEYLEQAAAEAAMSPARELAFRRLHLCQWTDTVTRWLGLDLWDGCQSPRPDLAGRVCYGALDLSSSMDLSAFVLAFPMDDGSIWLEPFCWAPRGALKTRERQNRQRFDQWAHAGFMEVTDGDVIEYEAVYQKIKELAEKHRIIDIAIDRWNCAQLAQQMLTDGLQVVAFGQGYASMSPAAKDFESLMIGKKLRHSGNPVLRWCAGNCSIESDAAGNIKPSKGKSSEKIDLLVASIMAVARARVGEAGGAKKSVPSVYEHRGLSFL